MSIKETDYTKQTQLYAKRMTKGMATLTMRQNASHYPHKHFAPTLQKTGVNSNT